MTIAIHNSKHEEFFSNRWIDYCKQNSIPHKIVNAYDNNIIENLKDCDFFLWHHSNYNYKDALFAKQLIYSIQEMGVKVFPDFKTTWHFDDKLGQKYLLEAVKAPLVPSYVFYSKKDAIQWLEQTTLPKVFKLRGGSGSSNVKLVKSKREALKLIKKSFGSGFSQFDRINHLKFRYGNFRSGKEDFIAILKGIARLFIGTEYSNNFTKEKGYIYLQEFMPNNNFDIRVIVIGDKAFGLKRMVRKDDFRASGSGNIIFEPREIDINCVKIAFETNKKLKTQSIAYDFVFDKKNKPLIVEISYGYIVSAYNNCPGYWDNNLKWHEGRFNPQEWMIQNLIKENNYNNFVNEG